MRFCGHSAVLGQSPPLPTQRLVTDHDTCQTERLILYFGDFQNSGWKEELPSLKEGGNRQRGVMTDVMCRFVGACVGASMCVGCPAVHLWEAEAWVYTAVVCIWKPEVDFYFSHISFRTGSLYEPEVQHLARTDQEAHRTHLLLPHRWCLIIDKCYPTCI